MTETNENIQMGEINTESDVEPICDDTTDLTQEENVRITRSMVREQGVSSIPQLKSAVESDTEWNADPVDITNFDKITSFGAFMMGIMMNWGSFNVMGFMMGMNYKFFLNRENTTRIYLDLQTVFPAFILGVFLININLMYFTASVLTGYAYRSRGTTLQGNVNSFYHKIPERYRDGMIFGTRNNFLREFLGLITETNNKQKKTD